MSDGDDERRNGSPRRFGDIEYTGELRQFRAELDTLRDKARVREKENIIRIQSLETKIHELQGKFHGVKGVFYGFALSITAVGYLVVDRVKELFIK